MDTIKTVIQWFSAVIFPAIPADATGSIEEIIESRGFAAEVHEVITKDGYILTLHRVVNPKLDKPGYPVLLMHGTNGSAEHFLIASEDGYLDENAIKRASSSEMDQNSNELLCKEYDNNIGFCLAKKGYDVWLANQRSARHSRKHANLDINDDNYWDFCLDDQVAYDLPAFIGKVLKVSGSKTLGYLGLSIGNTIMFGLLASQPGYNEVVKPFIALAPCYRMCNMRSPLKYVCRLSDYFYR